MSAAADAQHGPLARVDRVLRTPVVNLLRGHIGPVPRIPKLTYRQVIAQAGLPATATDTIMHVVRRTRLWPREKAQVAGELVAHFQDGLEAGRSESELLTAFGDVKQVARLIRRAKLRNRPVVWKLMRGLKRALELVFALALLVYAIQALRLYSQPINIARDYVAEWNAPSLAIPEAERAWPIYRAAVLMRDPQVPRYDDSDLNPDTPRLDELKAYIAGNQPAVELCRRAAGMGKLGAIFEAEPDRDLMRRLGFNESSMERSSGFYAVIQSPQCAALREVYHLLSLDAQMAVRAGDPARLEADLGALAGLSGHVFQLRTIIGDLVGLGIGAGTCRLIQSVLHEQPRLLSDGQLVRLSHRLAALAGGPDVRLNLASEYALLDDLLQHYYTDDGHGDGLPTVVIASGGDVVIGGWALVPASSIVMPSRRSTQELVRHWLARSEAEGRVPLWDRGPSEVEREIKQCSSSPLGRLYYAPTSSLLSPYSQAFLQCDYFMQRRDATLVAIALELYHRRTGQWPAALDELMPRYLPQVPSDRYDGKPIKYRLVDGQPLLYSVGADRVDDGGRLPEARNAGERPTSRNHRAQEWQPPGTADVARGDWLLWPPVED